MKLSPLSVPYRTVARGGSIVFTVLLLYSGASAAFGRIGALAGVGLAGAALAVLFGYEVAYYRRFEYALGRETLDIRSGVLSRRNREIPIRRVQNVDIRRNVVQRLLGIAAVDFETAGGSETEASLRFVEFPEAKRLQTEIGRLKRERGDGASTQEDAESETETGAKADADTEELFALTGRELAIVGAFSFDFRIPGFLFVIVSGGLPAVSSLLPDGARTTRLAAGVVALAVAVVLVSWLAGATIAVLNYYGFRLTRVGDELQYERGLLRRYDGSIPLDKVQTLTVVDNPLKRRFGFASLRIETAGYAPGSGEGGSEAAVPLAARDRVTELAERIEGVGVPTFDRPPKRVRRRYAVRYLVGLGVAVAVLYGIDLLSTQSLPWYGPAALSVLVPVAAHLKWHHRGYWIGDDHFLTRNGFLRRRTTVVPYYRIQTVIDSRTVFQRRWGLATVTADTAGSLSLIGADAAAVDVDDATAEELRATLPTRLRRALAARRGWIETEGDSAPTPNPGHAGLDANAGTGPSVSEGDGTGDDDRPPTRSRSLGRGDGDGPDDEEPDREGDEDRERHGG
ncbi:PH domain-containing protein [Haloplanus salilacus]|uniref:PH domain-containing protein n=1 Tax=Haloplanus salilacus TaxID=2949994 RepID=UPI0030D56422